MPHAPHAVHRLRTERLARAVKPFRARGGPAERCPGCRVMFSHCLCALRPAVPTRAGMCLLMADIEPLKETLHKSAVCVLGVSPVGENWRHETSSAEPQSVSQENP